MGTGFVMGRPILNTPDRARYVLITAAHVLNDMVGEGMTCICAANWERITGFELRHTIPIRANGQPLWTKHPDADVAVMYISLPNRDLPSHPHDRFPGR